MLFTVPPLPFGQKKSKKHVHCPDIARFCVHSTKYKRHSYQASNVQGYMQLEEGAKGFFSLVQVGRAQCDTSMPTSKEEERGTDSFKHPSLKNPISFRENRKTTTGRNVTIDFPPYAHSVCNEELKRGSGYKKLFWAEINLVSQTAFNIHELCWILAGKGGGSLIAFPPH